MKLYDITQSLRRVFKHFTVALALAAGLTLGSAQAQLTMSVTGNGTNGYREWGGEADGYKFTTLGSTLEVSWLGFYDAPNGSEGTVGDDLIASHRVSIWRESDGVLMAQTTVQPGDTLVGNFRGRNVTPVTLAANTAYVIAADYGGEGDRMQEGDDLTGWGINGITIQEGRYGDAGGGKPNTGYDRMMSANFGYTLAPLTVTLTSPMVDQGYPTGSSITASATVVEPGPFTDTVTFHTTPISPSGSTVQTVSTDTTSPFMADLGALPAGTYQIYATVENDDTPAGTATSATHTFTVAESIPTTITLAPAGAPTTYGDSVTLTATISPIPTGGTVQFYDGFNYLGSPVAVNTTTGEATYSTTALSAGTHEITAEYNGHWLHEASTTTASIFQEVTQAQLTVKALNTLRAPNTANPDPFPYQIRGYKNGQNLLSSGVLGAPELTTTAVLESPTGEYVITSAIGNLDAINYSFTFENGTLTIANVADTFSVNFYANGALATEEHRANLRVPAGVPAGFSEFFTSGWSNFEVPWAPNAPLAPVTLTSNQGSNATFTFKDCRNGGPYVWNIPRSTLIGDGSGNMMDGHVNSTLDGVSNKFDMEVTNIPFTTYDVIFYIGANEAQFGDGTGVIKFNGAADRPFLLQSGAFTGTFTEMVDGSTPGNYIVFRNVTGTSFTTQTWGTGTNGFNHIGPTGFQIREVIAASGYTAWATANSVAGEANEDANNDGVPNGIAYFMNDTGRISLPSIVGNTITWPNGGNLAASEYGATKQFVVETSPNLENWSPVLLENLTTNTSGPAGSLTYTLPPGLGKHFVRLSVTPTP